MSRFSDTLRDEAGIPIPGAQVYIYSSLTEALAALTNYAGSPIGNPVTTDEYGNYEFYASDNIYTFEYRVGGRRRLIREAVLVGNTPPVDDAIVAAITPIFDNAITQTGEARDESEDARDASIAASNAAAASAQSASTSATSASASATAAQLAMPIYPDIATGRAAVADNALFSVAGTGDVFVSLYRRDSSSTQTLLGQYPSKVGLENRTTSYYVSFEGNRPVVDRPGGKVYYSALLLQRPGVATLVSPSDYSLSRFELPIASSANANFHYIDVASIGTATNPVKSIDLGQSLRDDADTVALGMSRYGQFYPLFDNAEWIDQIPRPASLALEGGEAIRDRYNTYNGGSNALYFPVGQRFYDLYAQSLTTAISNSASTEKPGFAKIAWAAGGTASALVLRNSTGLLSFVDFSTFATNTRADANYYTLLGSLWGGTLDTTLDFYEPIPAAASASITTRSIAPDSASLTYDGFTRQIAKTSIGAQFARPDQGVGQSNQQYSVPSLRQAFITDSTSVTANISFEGTVEGVTTPASGAPFVASLLVNGTEVASVSSSFTGSGREVLTINKDNLAAGTKTVEIIAPYLRAVKFGPVEIDWFAAITALPADTRPLLASAGTSITASQNAMKTTVGWPFLLSRSADCRFINLGIPSRQCYAADGAFAGGLNPRLSTYDPFTNDYLIGQGQGRTLTASGNELTGYITGWFAANSDANSHLFIITPWTLATETANPTYTAAQYRTEATNRVNAWLSANPGVVDSMGRARLHVVNGASLVTVGDLSDGVHPNDAGHASIASGLYTAVIAYR